MGDQDQNTIPKFSELRRKAENGLSRKTMKIPENLEDLSPAQMMELLQELRIHQVELELQNEELHHAQVALEKSRTRYFELYNLAPVGYLTLDHNGLIKEANLTAGRLLNLERDKLIGQQFNRFIAMDDQDNYCFFCKQLVQPGSEKVCELRLTPYGGMPFWVRLEMVLNNEREDARLNVVSTDISSHKQAEEEELKLNQARLQSLVNIALYKGNSLEDLLDYVLKEALALSGSKLGYIYFYDEDKKEFNLYAWSRQVMQECDIKNRQGAYQLDNTGIWGEAIRQRKPIVVNDFEEPNPLKKGYPKGHVVLNKYMTVPVFSHDRIVAVVGVGNKEADYTKTDVLQLTLLMESAWNILKRIQAEQDITESHVRLLTIIDSMDALVHVSDIVTHEILFLNAFGSNAIGEKNILDVLGKKCWEVFQQKQSGPCSFCPCENLLDADGSPNGVHPWEYRNDNNGRWYYCQDRAIEWMDGRIAHLQIATDITELKRYEASLKASAKENEVLLRETHHRVKNNLAVITSLLDMQRRLTGDAKTAATLQELSNRIYTMALVHEKLYRSEKLSRINMHSYLQTLVSHLQSLFQPQFGVNCTVKAQDVELNLDTAIPCALIVHELVSNALKHAFPGEKPRSSTDPGEISVVLEGVGSMFLLEVSDNGVGLPPGLDLAAARTIGLRLVRLLGEHQLGATIILEPHISGVGTKFMLRFAARKS